MAWNGIAMRSPSRQVLVAAPAAMVVLVATVLVLNTSGVTGFAQLLGSSAAMVGAAAIWYQLKRTRDLSEAEFIVNLNATFGANGDIKSVYSKLETARQEEVDPFTDDDVASIVEYLTFFEALFSLIRRHVLSFHMIDDLFAYRFFLAVHNEYVQSRELVKDAKYYRNIYALHRGWTEYRDQNGKERLLHEHDLQNVVAEYDQLANVT